MGIQETTFVTALCIIDGVMMIVQKDDFEILSNTCQPNPSSKDIFYELENLSEIKDRTILKLFETDGSGRGWIVINIKNLS